MRKTTASSSYSQAKGYNKPQFDCACKSSFLSVTGAVVASFFICAVLKLDVLLSVLVVLGLVEALVLIRNNRILMRNC